MPLIKSRHSDLTGKANKPAIKSKPNSRHSDVAVASTSRHSKTTTAASKKRKSDSDEEYGAMKGKKAKRGEQGGKKAVKHEDENNANTFDHDKQSDGGAKQGEDDDNDDEDDSIVETHAHDDERGGEPKDEGRAESEKPPASDVEESEEEEEELEVEQSSQFAPPELPSELLQKWDKKMAITNNATSRTKDKENRGDAKITKVLDGGDAILEAQSCEGPCVTRAARTAKLDAAISTMKDEINTRSNNLDRWDADTTKHEELVLSYGQSLHAYWVGKRKPLSLLLKRKLDRLALRSAAIEAGLRRFDELQERVSIKHIRKRGKQAKDEISDRGAHKSFAQHSSKINRRIRTSF